MGGQTGHDRGEPTEPSATSDESAPASTGAQRSTRGRFRSASSEQDAREALEAARKMKPGPERAEALKRAGLLQFAADGGGVHFAKRGRPRK